MVQLHAVDALHQRDYNVVDAIKNLVSGGGPVLCRDEMEEWSASEANLFEEALDKYGKSFREIGLDFVCIITNVNVFLCSLLCLTICGHLIMGGFYHFQFYFRCMENLTVKFLNCCSCRGRVYQASLSTTTCGKPPTAMFNRLAS